MKLTTFSSLGLHRSAPRVWIESQRLERLGFGAATAFSVRSLPGRVELVAARTGAHHVSSKRVHLSIRPVIDLNSRVLLEPLAGHEEIKAQCSFGRILIRPSIRSFHIQSALAKRKFSVLDVFAGGGTLSSALRDVEAFSIKQAVELNPDYADVYGDLHPDTEILLGDIARIHPNEIKRPDIIVAGIPCTDFSRQGVTSKGLKGKRETGSTGHLFMSFAALVENKLPLAVLCENVPDFATSEAGLALKAHLVRLGYYLTETLLDPHKQWNEPCDRRRWVMLAALRPGFTFPNPDRPFAGSLGEYLDPANEALDRADAERIAGTIACLRQHNARHQAAGNGFQLTEINRESTKCPTITRCYHKKNSSGAYVQTPFGLRLLRKSEIERLHGCQVATDSFALATEVLGQGVLVRPFKRIAEALGDFLCQVDSTDLQAAMFRAMPAQMSFW